MLERNMITSMRHEFILRYVTCTEKQSQSMQRRIPPIKIHNKTIRFLQNICENKPHAKDTNEQLCMQLYNIHHAKRNHNILDNCMLDDKSGATLQAV